MPLLTSFFLVWAGHGLWGVRRFHNDIPMFTNPTEYGKSQRPTKQTAVNSTAAKNSSTAQAKHHGLLGSGLAEVGKSRV